MLVLTSDNSFFGRTTIYVSEGLIELWRTKRQLDRNANEAFGALIGSQSVSGNEVWLKECSIPQTMDYATRTSFSMCAPHHQTLVDSFYKRSNGELGYVGTWHTHPEPTPAPSSLDIADWHECTKRNPDRRLVFVIVGQVHICIFRMLKGSFTRICKEGIDD
ncbi:integrative and conjugative element protein (TIGR02256 family) [Idiomarina fontislapidosi]|uniref:JAB domain-containing protein n=1 Tax=Idiomarina fontislapidosi TaxID=263723 RepID=A0A432Y8N0_9GAMM|nr:Mov34/MPN/PAD-1 family protein [Idiomarina fontislapidosi]PYE33906.1 integrative and conjugative element protein (TIGR02256 family) [Idiomarina fontislapidosi]RUO57293.1 hypothetical protein CWE25_06400 [Idiomarina fontislapidosi]